MSHLRCGLSLEVLERAVHSEGIESNDWDELAFQLPKLQELFTVVMESYVGKSLSLRREAEALTDWDEQMLRSCKPFKSTSSLFGWTRCLRRFQDGLQQKPLSSLSGTGLPVS